MRISVDNLTKRFGPLAAVNSVSLSIEQGEMFTLLGPSGCGKTTLLRCFNRMVAPSAGEVLVGGTDVTRYDAPALRRRVGYVPQLGGLLPHWTVLRNAALVPGLLRRPDASRPRTWKMSVGVKPALTTRCRSSSRLRGPRIDMG